METVLFHPKVVHLPIALGLLMPLVAGWAVVALLRGGVGAARQWWLAVVLQAVLVGSAMVSMKTGEHEEERVEDLVGESAIHEHEEAAEGFVWGAGAVLALMVTAGALHGRARWSETIAGLATIGTFAVLFLGYRTGAAGGHLVYDLNAGAAYAKPAHPAAQGGEHGHDHDEHEHDDD